MINTSRRYVIDFPSLAILCADAVLIPAALWISIELCYSQSYEIVRNPIFLFAALTLLTVPLSVRFWLYRALKMRASWRDYWPIGVGVTLSSGILLVASPPRIGATNSALVIFCLLVTLVAGGVGLFLRKEHGADDSSKTPVAVYGAGESGRQLVKTLRAGNSYLPVLFLDDNTALHYKLVEGIPVLDPADQLADQLRKSGVKDIFLSMPSATAADRKHIIARLATLPVYTRTVPDMHEIQSGKARLDQVREIEIEELLGREPVHPNALLLGRCVSGKTVLVTGAAGSIGSELCRQIIRLGAKSLLLLEHSEFGLYNIESELKTAIAQDGLEVELVPLLGSVTDTIRIDTIFSAYDIETVFHAAAYKHVPIVEQNPLEGIKTNTFGTLLLADHAVRHKVSHFVLISTDKAVRPANVMGASKRLAEMVLQAMQHDTETKFCMVRFGNVLGSSGSVVPLFREQIRKGGPVTVTHPKITRFFMTIPEAVQLVIQAGAMAKGGDVFVLDMGTPIQITELARHMIQLSGFDVRSESNPNGIDIVFTGLRPGEKLYEELVLGSNISGTEHPKIMRAFEDYRPPCELRQKLEEMRKAMDDGRLETVRGVLLELVNGYAPAGDFEDLLQTHSRGEPRRLQPGMRQCPLTGQRTEGQGFMRGHIA